MAPDHEPSPLSSLVSKVTHALAPGVDADGAPQQTGGITGLYVLRNPVTMYPRRFGSQTPLGRPGQPVELAPVYVLLASQEASYTTGLVYGVTGGLPTA